MNAVTRFHGYVLGYAVFGVWIGVMVWALVLRISRREEAPAFWRFVSVAQVLLALQVLVGLVLLAFARRPGPAGNDGLGTLLFHLSYGLISPVVVLVVAHRLASQGRVNPFSAFAVVGLVNFGLLYRAYQVGISGG